MNLRDAFEEGFERSKQKSRLLLALESDGITDSEIDDIQQDIKIIDDEVEHYRTVLGGHYKETYNLVRRTTSNVVMMTGATGLTGTSGYIGSKIGSDNDTAN